MAKILAFLFVCAIAGLLFLAVIAIINAVSSSRSTSETNYKKLFKEEKQKRVLAERGLRKIANNNSGNPVLDAQISLEDVDKVVKEI